VEYRLRTGAGRWVWVEAALRPSADGMAVVSSRVIDERKRLEGELVHRATHDGLTGLANRTLAVQQLREALGVDRPDHVGLLFCDLDKFKAINDRLGHEVGDELLQLVAGRLRGSLRPTDLLARFGGDEFVVVLDGIGKLSEVAEIGQRVSRAMEDAFILRGERIFMSASVGGVLGVRRRATASEMLRDADAAMYVAKERGQGHVEVFDEAASHRSLDRLDLRSDLQRALERNQLSLRYQPIVDLDDGRAVAFEALLRWHHPRRGMVPPGEFIPLAEETGAILPIGRWMLAEACRQLAEWRRRPYVRTLAMSVNISPIQLQQPQLGADMLSVIKESGVDPSDIWLEVSEHSQLRYEISEPAQVLRAAGVRFALDDFGVSYASLGYLKRFPVEMLKIDRSFVSGVATRDSDRGIVQAVVAIAASLGLDVVAEGIETPAERDALRSFGCHRGQGFLLAPPLTAERATALIDAAGPSLVVAPMLPARP
jgi:diguanylate cyclase (GGDEF)-like protein